MFEHLDDPAPPIVTSADATSVWREARRRTVRTFTVATACLAVTAGVAVAAERQIAGREPSNVAVQPSAGQDHGNNGNGNANGTTPSTKWGSADAPTTSALGTRDRRGETGDRDRGQSPGTGSNPASTPTTPGGKSPGTVTTVPNVAVTNPPADPGAQELEFAATTVASAAADDVVSVTITAHNPGPTTQTFEKRYCDPLVRRLIVSGSTMEPDFDNCGETRRITTESVAGGQTTVWTQQVKLHNRAGALKPGHYMLHVFVANVAITVV
jgi:hypothetical protein